MSRILVIDDEDIVRGLVVEILETAGYDVTAASSAEAALVAPRRGLRPDRQRRDHARALRARIARGGAQPARLAAGRARDRRRHLRHAQPGAHPRRSRARDEAVRARRPAERGRRCARACVAQPRRAPRAPARADARERARERDRGPRLVSPRPLRTARRARRPDRRGARALAGRDRGGPPRSDPPRRRQDRHPRPRAAQARRARRGGARRSSRRIRRSATSCSSRSTCSRLPARSSATITSAGTAPATRTAWPARRSRSARASSRSPTRSRSCRRASSTARRSAPTGSLAELRACAGRQWDPQIVEIVLRLIESGELVLSADGLHLLERRADEVSAAGLAVLLVEDEDDHAKLLSDTLETALDGAVIVRARSVTSAAELAARFDWALAIVDHQLPDGAGVEVVETLRADDAEPVDRPARRAERRRDTPRRDSPRRLAHDRQVRPVPRRAGGTRPDTRRRQPAAHGASVVNDPRCLVADDHPALTSAVSNYLADNGFEIVGPASDGRRALALAESEQPDLALVDYRMPRLSGLELLEALHAAAPEMRICVYTADGDEQLARDVLAVGRVGSRPQGGAARRPRPRARSGARRRRVSRPGGRPNRARRDTHRTRAPGPATACRGLPQEEIARRLGISAETVRTHLRKACTRLGATTRTQAVATALRLGLIA